MHGVLAISELILSGGEGACVNNTLLSWVHVSIILSGVSMSVNCPLTGATHKMTSVLIVCVMLCRTRVKGLAALG